MEKIQILNVQELQVARDLLLFFNSASTMKIKILNAEEMSDQKKYNICLMLAPANYNKNEKNNDNEKVKVYQEFISKVVYIESEIIKFIDGASVEYLFNKIFTRDINIIVKCSYSNNDISISKCAENSIIEVGYSKLEKVFKLQPSILSHSQCQNTLFIFENITWEALQIIFNSLFIRLSGGSHSKRHVISPLDLKLLDTVERLRRLSLEIVKRYNIGEVTEREEMNIQSQWLLEGIISKSYNKNERLKSLDVKSIYKKYFKLFSLLGNNPFGTREFPELLFLYHYRILVENPYLYLIRKEKAFSNYPSVLSKVEQRIDELTTGSNSNVSIKIK